MTHRPGGRTRLWLTAVVSASLMLGTMAALAPTASAAPSGADGADRPAVLGKSLYTGELHSHTSVSDGVQLPPDAWAHVKDDTAADFFALSEHDVMWDLRNGDDFVDDWRDAESQEWRDLHEKALAFNASQDQLVAVPAVENTWYDGTGHINVFNSDWKATARATEKGSVDGYANGFGTGDLKYDMYTFFARLKQDPDAIAQFNHPSTSSKGNFFGFNGLDRAVDDKMELIEVRSAAQYKEFIKALDTGWHLAPVWNGDEHSANWVSSNQAITGIWAKDHTLKGLYGAMKDRSTYSTDDINAVLAFSGNDQLMGSILPADTDRVSFDVQLSDPDATDSFRSVELVTNGGRVVRTFDDVAGRDLTLRHEQDVTPGDYYLLRAVQADGHAITSAPIWVGETTRDANYAPKIVVPTDYPSAVDYDQELSLPRATATDDSGSTPEVTYEVFDAAGLVPVTDGLFTVRSYDDHFVVAKSTDAQGNIGTELIRLQVRQDDLDPAGVFQYLGSTATVSSAAGGAGLSVSTDRSIRTVYAQVISEDEDDWSKAKVLTSTNDKAYEVNTIGNAETTYQQSITGQTLRSHEFDLTGLTEGRTYKYRFGVASAGAAPSSDDGEAWTATKGEFVAGGGDNTPIYAIGDLQATSHEKADLSMLRGVLDRLQDEAPGGRTLLQTGDLVDNGGRGQYWQEVFDHVFEGLDVQYAPVSGNHETYGDLEYNSSSPERTAVFSNMFDTPKNGAIGESNYSFDRGDVHVSVLNSVYDMDRQIEWLTKDIRASDKRWNVVTGHYSYYGGSHGDDGPLAADRPKLTAAFDRLGVDLYVGGHDHIYKRSTIYDGRLATTAEEEAAGTTFVTLGSAGPKFYDNVVHWWDDVVFDEDTQIGTVLQVKGDALNLATYTVDGREVDSFDVRKPANSWRITSTDVKNNEMSGVGVISHEGSTDSTTLMAATYDRSGHTMRAARTVKVELDHMGSEQFATFDSPLPVRPSDTVKVFAWDGLVGARPMKPAKIVREGIEGQGTAEDPYLISSGDDLDKIANDPSGHYRLTKDLDLSGGERSQLDRVVTFRGVLDGAGHTIKGFTTPQTQGVGLFADNWGTIRNLAVVGTVSTTRGTIGLVADTNHGIIERVRTAGSISGSTRVGGIAGDHYGTIRDSYSTANVSTTGVYSGGVVAVALGGSTTERVYSTGAVTATTRNAGGLVSYGYEDTTVTSSVALNERVQSPTFAHAIVGRIAAGQIPVLAHNYVSSGVTVIGESVTTPAAADNERGEVVRSSELRKAAFFDQLGWNMDSVWEWNAAAKRPLLKGAVEPIDAGTLQPTLDQAPDGSWLVKRPEDLEQLVSFPEESYRLAADLDLAGTSFRIETFNGVLDGDGHTISNLRSTAGGMFGVLGVEGVVQDLGMRDVAISKSTMKAGAVADTVRGAIERVWVSGDVTALSYAGGITGESFGTIRDAYSIAKVSATGGNYAGGIVGVADSPSLTERVYATGVVTASGSSAGGVAGYARNAATVIRSAFALNPTVTGTSTTQRVVARSATGVAATLSKLFALDSVSAAVQSSAAVGPEALNGESVAASQAGREATWRDQVGFDFGTTWQWSLSAKRPVLQSATEELPAGAQTEPDLDQAGDGAWLVKKVADLNQLALFPGQSYRLTADLDLAGTAFRVEAFSGVLDGAGHTISGLRSTSGGLFGVLTADGRVRDLGLSGVAIAKSTGRAGAVADTLRGTVERVWVSGEVKALSYAGGIAGESFGTIRDAYSTAKIVATGGSYAGGIVGVADSPSLTERVYATGAVSASAPAAGGVSGYARNSATVIRSALALNPTVAGSATSHRVVGRAANGQTPGLSRLFAVDTLVATVQSDTSTGPTTFNGQSVSADQMADRATWTAAGFDLEAAWRWDATRGRPVLAAASSSSVEPARHQLVSQGSDVVTAVAVTPTASHQVSVDQQGLASVDVALGRGAAEAEAGVLVLRPGADPRSPADSDIVFVDQHTTGAEGSLTFTADLGDSLARQWLTVGTDHSTNSYGAWLDPQAEPITSSIRGADLTVVRGTSAVLTADVTGGELVPTGKVSFSIGDRALGEAVLDSQGRAVLTAPTADLPVGDHRVRMTYAGDGLHPGATGELTLTVEAKQPDLAVPRLTAFAPWLTWGSKGSVLVRVVGPAGAGTGQVDVMVGSKLLGRTRLVNGTATVPLQARSLRPGTHALTVRYSGDTRYVAAASSVRATVARTPVTLRVGSVSPRKIVAGRTRAVFKVRIGVPAGVSRSGTVTVRGAGIKTVRVPVVRGTAKVRLPAFRSTGTKRLTVTYSGSGETKGRSAKVRLKVVR